MATDDQVFRGLSNGIEDPNDVLDGRDFARALTALREAAGLSVREVARKTRIPSATLGGYYSGRHLPTRPTQTLVPILRACGAEETAIRPWISALGRARRVPGPKPRTSAQPYRGLKHFDVQDAEWFFGREQVTDRLVERVSAAAANSEGPAIVVVTGPSGCGKSSLLRAGLVPTIGDEVLVMSPGTAPLTDLAGRLAERAAQPADLIEAELRRNPFAPARQILDSLPALLVIDQFEQLFTGGIADQEREAFVAAVCGLTSISSGLRKAVAVLVLRSDFYRQASEEPALLQALQDNQVLLGPMDESELRSAIVEPAHRSGVTVDDDLVELILREMAASGGHGRAHDPGSLPLMSHALMETWQHARRGHLTRSDYLGTGGIRRAAQQTAENLFAELTFSQQALARRIFLRLTHVEESQPLTRRRITRAELLALSTRESEVDHVLELFVARRLLTSDADQIEISHESLLLAWPRLAGWIEQDRTSLRRLRQLTALAQQWQAAGRDDDGLLRGLRLEDTMRWLAAEPRWRSDLNQTELDFLTVSDLAEARRHSLHLRGVRRTRRLVVAVSVLAVIVCVLPGYIIAARARSDQAQRDARQQTAFAQSRQAAVEAADLEGTDPALASQLALASYRIAPTVEARSALLDSQAVPAPTRFIGQPGPTAIAASADGHDIAMSNAVDGSVQLLVRNLTHQAPTRVGLIPGTGKPNQLFALAFSPRAAVLATGGQDSVVRLWNIHDPSRPKLIGAPLTGIKQAVETIVFSPNGQLLTVGGGGKTVRMWDVGDPDKPRQLIGIAVPGVVQSAAFAKDGRILAVAGENGLLQRWDVTIPRRPRLLSTLPNVPIGTSFESIAFSPDGSLLAAGSKDGSLRLWAHPTSEHAVVVKTSIPKISQWVDVVAFSPNGHLLAAGNTGNTVVTWSVGTWRQELTLAHAGPVTGSAFLPDGSGLLTSSEDGTGHLWPMPGPDLTGAQGNVFRVSYSNAGVLAVGGSSAEGALQLWGPGLPNVRTSLDAPADLSMDGTATISPDGRLAAAGTHGGALVLWRLGTSAPVQLLAGSTALVEYLAFSPNSTVLAAGGDDDVIHLWDLADPAHPRPLPTLTGDSSFIFYLDFSPDGRTLASASVDKTVRLWDLSKPAAPRELATLTGFASYAASVTFSPNGRLLIAGGTDHLIRIWDISDLTHPKSMGPALTGPANSAFSVAVSPDSTVLAVGSTDHTVRLWDITDPQQPRLNAILRAAGAAVYTVAFSPDGAKLAAGGTGGDVHLWPVSASGAARQICDLGGDPISPLDWHTYIADIRYSAPCAIR